MVNAQSLLSWQMQKTLRILFLAEVTAKTVVPGSRSLPRQTVFALERRGLCLTIGALVRLTSSGRARFQATPPAKTENLPALCDLHTVLYAADCIEHAADAYRGRDLYKKNITAALQAVSDAMREAALVYPHREKLREIADSLDELVSLTVNPSFSLSRLIRATQALFAGFMLQQNINAWTLCRTLDELAEVEAADELGWQNRRLRLYLEPVKVLNDALISPRADLYPLSGDRNHVLVATYLRLEAALELEQWYDAIDHEIACNKEAEYDIVNKRFGALRSKEHASDFTRLAFHPETGFSYRNEVSREQ